MGGYSRSEIYTPREPPQLNHPILCEALIPYKYMQKTIYTPLGGEKYIPPRDPRFFLKGYLKNDNPESNLSADDQR
tara:strand:+ start:2472 stop:2699 length:228 start_codon:yes stop_codon:yes gene_type:complete